MTFLPTYFTPRHNDGNKINMRPQFKFLAPTVPLESPCIKHLYKLIKQCTNDRSFLVCEAQNYALAHHQGKKSEIKIYIKPIIAF